MRRRSSLVDGLKYVFGIGIKTIESINVCERESRKESGLIAA